MREPMKSKQEDTSNTSSSAKENRNNSQLVIHEAYPGSPFTHVEDNEKGHFLVMGDFRLTEPFKTKKELQEWLADNTWNMVLSICAAVCARTLTIVKDEAALKELHEEMKKV